MTGMQIAVLFVLVSRDEQSLQSISKAQIGALVGVSERHVTTILQELERDLTLIKTEKGKSPGRGRAPNRYVPRPDSTGSPVPDDWAIRNSKSGTPNPELIDIRKCSAVGDEVNQHRNSGTRVPDKTPPMDKHACARVLDKFLPLENNSSSERLELVVESVSARAMAGGGPFNADWTMGEPDRAFANEMGFMNGSADALFDRFKDHFLATGKIYVNWNARWRKWVRDEVNNHDFKPSARAGQQSSDGRGRSGESFTDFMRKRATPSDALDLGRVGSVPVK